MLSRNRLALVALSALLAVVSGCPEGGSSPIEFSPDPIVSPDTRPGFTSRLETVSLVNNSGSSYQISGVTVTSQDPAQAAVFSVELAGDDSAVPVLAPGESLSLLVDFSPQTIADYSATVTAITRLVEYDIGGGGCSSGCGSDAPSDSELLVSATVVGRGDADADFEDCDDGIDNDSDGFIDCDDPDCANDPACEADDEICDDGLDNDGDGLVDCEDPDCAFDPECGEIVGCEPGGDVLCGLPVEGGTLAAENNWNEYCGQGGQGGFTGGEEIWSFRAESTGEVEVAAQAFGWNLEMTVLEATLNDDGTIACDPDNCLTTSWSQSEFGEFFSFDAVDGQLYFLVVDGRGQADRGDYLLQLQCATGFEQDCDDGLDNDGDGLVDCDDPDCANDPACGGQACVPVDTLTCPTSIVSGSNGGPGSTQNVESWCSSDANDWTGPETAWLFSPSSSGQVTVDLFGTDPNADLDLIVLLVPPNGPSGDPICDPDICVTQSFTPGPAPEQVTFQGFAGSQYLIVVDGRDASVSSFQMVMSCGGGGEICDDGVDNDADGAIDCDDPDCFGDPNCGGAELCFDGVDNDGDGFIDCDDVPDCQAFPGCDYGDGDCCDTNGTAGCENDLGEDCVCAADPFCCTNTWDALCVDVFQNTCGGSCDQDGEVECADGIDNDNDGLIDCDDADCFGDPSCVGPQFEFSCVNNVDDDGDGLVDCDDPDCVFDPACVQPGAEICGDGADNDGDGFIDCDDSDCVLDPFCDAGDGECCAPGNSSPGCDDEVGEDCVCAQDPFCCNVAFDSICADLYVNQCGGSCTGNEDCSNGLDDDGDGFIDCDDADCINDPNCVAPGIELFCNNNVDDDGDGLVDCADPDCAADPNCQVPGTETACADGLDNDQDGQVDCADDDCTFDAACDAGDGDCCTANGTPGCSDEPGEDCVCTLDPFCCNNQWDGLCANQYQNQCGGSCTGTEVCTNGLDDDTDGLIDCDDPDCFGDPSCAVPTTETSCTNNVDDDLDGFVDCDDSDCALNPNCNIPPVEISCNNGIDDDQDGATDCADSDCASFPGCVNPPEANCANGIDDDADGLTDCNDSDCATNPNCANGEFDCDDGIDNDSDGQVDCDDGDCSADIACVSTGQCNPIGNITCGAVITGNNSMAGSTNQQDEYCGFNPAGWSGPEVSWLFTPPADGFVDVTLTGLTADLDIQALVQDGSSCDPNDCEANGWNPPPQPEQMDWFAFAGTPYYILIDGWQGAVSDFTMTVTCTPLEEIDCSDGIDDDQDGQVDCDDIDCLGSASCPETVCTDGIDNDADGFVDCNDVDCFGTITCIPEFLCANGLDDDSDGLTDCDDSDCAGDPNCVVPVPETNCSNGVDDDGDGLVDCADSDCATDPSCVSNTEVCDDGLDNDQDGDEDCFDSDCAGFPGCATETDCSNGFDDDADGLADCNDTDCFGAPGCPLVLFSSVDDDPADFAYVPLGQNSSSVVWELGVPDTASQSNSGPAAAFNGTDAWCTGCSTSVEDSGRFQAYMVANPNVFDLSALSGGQLILSFEHWQVSPGIPFVDTARVDCSDDGGASINTEWGPNVASTGGWDHVEIDLSSYLGGDLTFAFRYDTLFGFGGGQDDDGWYIDDVELIWYP